jgi:hypothetical protein
VTFSVLEFTDINESTGDVIYPAIRRRTAQALSATYAQIGETALVRAILVYNDSATVGIHLRVATASSGQDATQADPYIGPDQSAVFLIHRKDRSTTNPCYINAVADT